MDKESSVPSNALKRELGLFTCILLVIGNIIGVGIFTTPGKIAHDLPTAGWVLVAWAVGGLMTTAGALAYGELGAMFPRAGGEYVFLKEAFGPLVAFLYGFAYSLVTTTGTVAFLAIAFAGYLGMDTGSWQEAIKSGTLVATTESKVFSIFVVAVLTFLNCRGVKLGAGVMDLLTGSKLIVMFLLVGLGFALGHGHLSHFVPLFSGETTHTAGSLRGPRGSALVTILFAIGAALGPMAYAYSGWNSTVLMAEEVRRPEKIIPLSLILGTLLTALIYVLMNAVYIYAIPLQDIVGTKTVAKEAASNLFGSWAQILAQGLVALSVLGCLSATMLSNPRTVFAMGRDGLFFKWAGNINPKYQTPNAAILLESIVGCGFILFGSFEQILDLLGVTLVVIWAMTMCSIFVLRVKLPHHPRPYRCWGYPFVPASFILLSLWMLYSTYERGAETGGWRGGIASLQGIFVVLGGIPVYYFMVWYKKWRSADGDTTS
jgi:APA family basic amino acid/polyamine antiporter